MSECAQHHDTCVVRLSLGNKVVLHRIVSHIDGLAGEEELANLVERLNKASTAYGMEISAEKTQADDKQHQWHQHRDQSKWTEA